MIGDEFSEVDIDLLADYVGGVLDGTPEQDRVVVLIAHDPAWRAAHAALAEAMAAVGAELHELGAAAEPMPADLAVRLTTLLDGLPPATRADDPPESPPPATTTTTTDPMSDDEPGARPRLVAVRSMDVSRGAGRAARRRGIPRWAAPATLAAAAVALAGVGIGQLVLGGATQEASSRADAPAALSATQETQQQFDGALAWQRVLATGTDYRRATLDTAALGPLSAQGFADKEGSSDTAGSTAVPALLRPLTAPGRLTACLDAITAEHAAGPLELLVVDLAGFEGTPAAVVQFTAADGRWVWVSGPDCGTPKRQADTRYQVRVG